jgi:hypothetical protein
MIELVKSHIFNSFGLDSDTSNRCYIKVHGMDTYSLAKWISEEFNNVKVTFDGSEWIKVKPSNYTEFIITE